MVNSGSNLGTAVLDLRTNNKGLDDGLRAGERSADSFVSKFSKGIFGVTAALGAAGAAVVGFAGVVGFNFNSMRQQAEIAFGTMLGSAEKAKSFLDELQEFAATTPFEFGGLVQASQKLLAMGFAAESVVPMMTSIGDAVAGLGLGSAGLDRVTTALGQIQAKGKTASQEMMQLTESGIPAWKYLAEVLGTDIAGAMDAVTKGAVDSKTTIDAVLAGMDRDFGGLMEKQSRSWSGLWSTVKDTFSIAMGTLTGPLFERATAVLQKFTDFISSPKVISAAERLGRAIGGILTFAEGLFKFDEIKMLSGLSDIGLNSNQMVAVINTLRTVKEVIQAVQEQVKRFGQFAMPYLERFGAWAMDHKEIFGAAAIVIGGALVAAIVGLGISIATAIAPLVAIGAAMTAVVATVIYVIKHWDELMERFPKIAAVVDFAVAVFKKLAPAVQSTVEFVVNIFGHLTSWFRGTLFPALDELREKFLNDVWPAVRNVASFIGEAFKLLFDIVGPIVTAIGDILKATWDQAWTVTKAVWPVIREIVEFAVTYIRDFLSIIMAVIRGDWKGAWEGMKTLVDNVWDGVGEILRAGKDAILKIFEGAGEWLKSVGEAIINGLWDGMKNIWNRITGWLGDQANKLPDWIKGPLQISSPSRVFEEIGLNIMEGLGMGLEKGIEKSVIPAMNKAVDIVGGVKFGGSNKMHTHTGVGGEVYRIFRDTDSMADAIVNSPHLFSKGQTPVLGSDFNFLTGQPQAPSLTVNVEDKSVATFINAVKDGGIALAQEMGR